MQSIDKKLVEIEDIYFDRKKLIEFFTDILAKLQDKLNGITEALEGNIIFPKQISLFQEKNNFETKIENITRELESLKREKNSLD